MVSEMALPESYELKIWPSVTLKQHCGIGAVVVRQSFVHLPRQSFNRTVISLRNLNQ